MEILGDFQTSVRKALEEIDPQYESYRGLIICGTHAPKDWEPMIEKIKAARETMIPFLGICFGHQLAAIEYARNVRGIEDATSEELDANGTFVVKKLDQLNVGMKHGESYWNNYEVDLSQWQKPEYMITTQFHPEYQSTKDKPHPLLIKFIELCKQQDIQKK